MHKLSCMSRSRVYVIKQRLKEEDECLSKNFKISFEDINGFFMRKIVILLTWYTNCKHLLKALPEKSLCCQRAFFAPQKSRDFGAHLKKKRFYHCSLQKPLKDLMLFLSFLSIFPQSPCSFPFKIPNALPTNSSQSKKILPQ